MEEDLHEKLLSLVKVDKSEIKDNKKNVSNKKTTKKHFKNKKNTTKNSKKR